MDSASEHTAMRCLNMLQMLLFKSIATVDHSNANLSIMLINATKQEPALEQKLQRYTVFSMELHRTKVIIYITKSAFDRCEK